MSRVLVAAPLRLEQALIRLGAPRRARVLHTGMGPHKSRAAAGTLRGEAADAMIVLGFCGGLDAQARPGEVIVADEVLTAGDEGHAPQRYACDGTPSLAEALARGGLTVRSGPIVCVGRLALGERREQLRVAGALAVDMESVWLAGAAGSRPLAVVRVVLDSPSHELLRPQALAGAWRAASALRRASAISLQEWPSERLR
jgi:4-hydroxy-3-methylbut-2-enyl diphosphate reductase